MLYVEQDKPKHITYLVQIEKSGYETETELYTTSDTYLYKTFKLDPATSEEEPVYDFYDYITFNGTMHRNGTLVLFHSDSSGVVQSYQIYVYEVYNEIMTLIENTSQSNKASYTMQIFNCNTSRLYVAYLYFNHTYNFTISQPIILMFYKRNMSKHTQEHFDAMLTAAFGVNPLGWANTFAVFSFLLFLLGFAPTNAGIGIITGAASIVVIELIFVLNNFALVAAIPILILLGIFYIAVKKRAEEVL